jgi:hypothetical protein
MHLACFVSKLDIGNYPGVQVRTRNELHIPFTNAVKDVDGDCHDPGHESNSEENFQFDHNVEPSPASGGLDNADLLHNIQTPVVTTVLYQWHMTQIAQ